MKKLNEKYLFEVCKLGKGPKVCIFLLAPPDGFVCGKLDAKLSEELQKRSDAGEMVAQGNNCDGYGCDG